MISAENPSQSVKLIRNRSIAGNTTNAISKVTGISKDMKINCLRFLFNLFMDIPLFMIFGSRFAAPDLSDLNPFYWMPSLVLASFHFWFSSLILLSRSKLPVSISAPSFL